MKDIRSQYERNGFVVLEDLFKPEEVDEMRFCGEEYTDNLPPENERCIFNTVTSQQSKDTYFLESANIIRVFFEGEALDSDGKLKVHPRVSLHKIGHALHWLHPTFKKYSFDERIKEAMFQLDYKEPAICQSMYLFKNPGIGTEISMHQDATYLYTEPVSVVGVWIALEDATQENGCLWFAPGSHKSGVHRRYVRNKDPDSKDLLVYDSANPCYQLSNFRPVPVKKGSVVLIHGQVVHFSYPNKSDKSRHAYTFHVIETQNTTYPKENWIPVPPEGFPKLYRN
ncbi:phytanoyl-CoA dioxygenase domain containing 1 isoform X2 [Nomia melanderi]|uniref:phytanoyl-CoA dioxygenase domain containing 1 isoform X2 n=1 Tax=Nomia melanderi TaxID=2448451 RepID=UPI003FCCB352